WTGSKPSLQIWDVAKAQPIGPLHEMKAGAHTPCVTDDGRMVRALYPHYDQLARLDGQSGRLLGMHKGYGPPVSVCGLAMRGDGLRFATGTYAGRIHQWDIESGTAVGPALEHGSPAERVAYSPEGDLLAGACNDGTVRVWDAAAFRPVGPALPHLGRPAGLAFTAGGRALVTATYS